MPKWMEKPRALSGVIKDIDFEVEFADQKNSQSFRFKDFGEACARAVVMAVSGSKVHLDVLIYNEAAARAWGGEDAVEQYREDPDASVSQRIVITADDQGRVA